MTEADSTQVKILNANRLRLEDHLLHITDHVAETAEALGVLEGLKTAAYSASEAFKGTPYLAGAIVILLSDMAELVRENKPISYSVVEAICGEIITLHAYRSSLSESKQDL